MIRVRVRFRVRVRVRVVMGGTHTSIPWLSSILTWGYGRVIVMLTLVAS